MSAAEPEWVAPIPIGAYFDGTRMVLEGPAAPELAFTEYHDGERMVDGQRPQPEGPPITEPWPGLDVAPEGFQTPEDRGRAIMSPLGDIEYVENLIRPGRILIVAAEEGTGKTVSILGELAIRFAVAGGSFAGTWPVLETGAVLVLSEQHPDDDHRNEDAVLAALDLTRDQLTGRYFRLPTMTAAGDKPPLMDPEWRDWASTWMERNEVRLFIVDTATGATNVEPWGKDMQEVYRGLRRMTEDLTDVAIVLLLHLKKPSGKGERRISDVLGEWGRWCDVVLLMEDDGDRRVKLTTRKRVRVPRRVIATQRDYLLVDPIDLTEKGAAKVPTAKVLAAIAEHPGITYTALGKVLKVSKDTASRYVKGLGDAVVVVAGSRTSPASVYLAGESGAAPLLGEGAAVPQVPHTLMRHPLQHPDEAPPDVVEGEVPQVPHPPYRGAAHAAAPLVDPDLTGAALAAFGDLVEDQS